MRTLQAFLFTAAMAACTGGGAVRYSGQATVYTPTLVTVEPGVQVVADYDEPVFYSEGAYWRYTSGVWYRSPYYDRAWVRVETVPYSVRRIDRPERYVHYRARARTGGDTQALRRDNREIRRDHNELARDRNEIERDKREIEMDKRRGDQKELERDRRELARDAAETKRDREELNKDQRKKEQDAKKAKRR
jgi:hypothetical protein